MCKVRELKSYNYVNKYMFVALKHFVFVNKSLLNQHYLSENYKSDDKLISSLNSQPAIFLGIPPAPNVYLTNVLMNKKSNHIIHHRTVG